MRDLFYKTWPATYLDTLGVDATNAMLAELDESQLKSIMPQDDEVTLVAIQNEVVVGTLTYALRQRVTYVWGMYVLPNFQRHGVGSRLILQTKRNIKNSDSIEVRVLQSSKSAVSFYHKLGFNIIGDETTDLASGFSTPTLVMSSLATLTK
jgi:ribosomal protein S18 acetylase RimI-like enzyme